MERLVTQVESEAKLALQREPKTWLVTGAAGFIGSHLVEALLNLDQRVIGLDNLSSGKLRNFEEIRNSLKPADWSRFTFLEADVRDLKACQSACKEVDFVLHHAAFCSVPASVAEPLLTHEVNVTGFVNLLSAARATGVHRFVYASSSAVYGDHLEVPGVEEHIGNPLSPYGLSKRINELYADTFARNYRFPAAGLRYYNVFGPRQDPNGAYAAVVPRWIFALLNGETPTIYGDGETTRDFCFVHNVVQANILAALAPVADPQNQIYNIGSGESTSLTTLYRRIEEKLGKSGVKPSRQDPRPGDIRHSCADISKARQTLGFEPAIGLSEGLDQTIAWFRRFKAP